MPEVSVVGAGPVGLLLAAELGRLGVDVEILEERPRAGPGSRAIGVHAPVLAALEDSGLTDQLLAHAVKVGRGEARSGTRLLGTVRFDRLSARHPFVATLPQSATERVLATAAPEPRRGIRITGLHADDRGVNLSWADGSSRSPLVVLAGGPRSRELVYREPGARVYPDRYLMVDAQVSQQVGERVGAQVDQPVGAPLGERGDADTAVVHLDAGGVLESFPLPDGWRRYVAWDPPHASSSAADQRDRMARALELRAETDAAAGLHCVARDGEDADDAELGAIQTDTAAGARSGPVTAFGVRRFVAERMRDRRLFVVGDAAHEVSPIGGQGMNLGLLDAVSLAPLLAQWVHTGSAPEAELRRWERARIVSARRAATLAAMNTVLGRPARGLPHRAREQGVRLMLGPGGGRVFAHAYAMGFDADG